MCRLLDPTLDIVFKLLFTSSPGGHELLVLLLTAVLRPPSPIADVTVLNPDIAKESVLDKGIVLDLLVRFEDGTRVDIEMQADKRPAFPNRALYYWARTFSGQLERGELYSELCPVISVLFVNYVELPGRRLHSVFRLLEAHEQTRFTDALEMHVIELPKLRQVTDDERNEDPSVVRWARFFAARSDEEIHDSAMGDPAITKAKAELERLSMDPAAQQLARDREIALSMYRMELSAARREASAEGEARGRAEGEERGEARGRIEGRSQAILDMLADRGIAVSDETKAQILACHDLSALRSWAIRAASVRSAEELFAS